jgi:hypothetical protein
MEYLSVPTESDFAEMQVERITLPQSIPAKSVEQRFQTYPLHDIIIFLSFIKRIFVYKDSVRLSAWEACSHKYDISKLSCCCPLSLNTAILRFFEILRSPDVMLPNGQPLPDSLFDFSTQEIASMPSNIRAELTKK